MNYKKTLLTTSILAILFGTTQANDYISIISQEKNIYDVIENSLPVATEWVDKGTEFNCVKEFSAYDYPLGQTFTQNENCLQKQERTITTTEIFNGTPRTTVKIDTQNIPVIVSYLETGQENYNTGSQRTEYTTWLDDGTHYSCGDFLPLESTINLGESFTQNRGCSQDQERTETIYDIWADGSEILNSTNVENRILTELECNPSTGTKNFNTGSQRTEYTNWLDDGIHYDCSFNKLTSEVYTGVGFTQIKSCSQNQNRTKTVYDIWADNSETLSATEIETQTLNENESNEAYGTLILNSCKAILDGNHSIGDGMYQLQSSGNPSFEAYCDMTTDEGGWTRIIYDGATLNTPNFKNEINELWGNGINKFIKFETQVYSTLVNSTIYYKRLTNYPIDFYENTLKTFRNFNNLIDVDFKMNHSYLDLQVDTNNFLFCNFSNDPDPEHTLVGFPRDCAQSISVGGRWIAMEEGRTTSQPFTVYNYKATMWIK